MAIYKIFPIADASIYSAYPAKNTGLDEILEVSVKNSDSPGNFLVDPVPSTPIISDDLRRSIVLFSNSDIQTLQSLASGSYQVNFRMYLANAENLTTQYTIEFKQVTGSWDMGTGKFSDNPETRNGVCWYNSSSYVTSSNGWQNPSYYLTPGGGSWTNISSSQTFGYHDNKDVNVDVTNIVNSWFSSSANNGGILIKHTNDLENNSGSFIVANYFSVDTHTIYPPCLELRWDDSTYSTGSLGVVSNSDYILTLANNPDKIKSETGKYQFRINARDKYPARAFSTSSVYLTNKALPSSSYWSIQDVKTLDTIIDFDNNYTKVSCDSQGSYFNVYISGLEPERYYKTIVKSVLPTGETLVIDNNNIFKIVR